MKFGTDTAVVDIARITLIKHHDIVVVKKSLIIARETPLASTLCFSCINVTVSRDSYFYAFITI